MVLIILAGLLSVAAFGVLVRLLWLSGKNAGPKALVALAAAVLVIGLAVLTATGRLHWLVAVGAAVLPFLRRGLGLLRFLPWVRSAYRAGSEFKQGANRRDGAGARPTSGNLSAAEARDILGLGANPSRQEIIDAHRRLIQKLHPDRGGSTYLAQQLNEAKRVLLEKV